MQNTYEMVYAAVKYDTIWLCSCEQNGKFKVRNCHFGYIGNDTKSLASLVFKFINIQ